MSLCLEQVALTLGGRYLVKDVSLRLDPGEVVGLLGPNGAGKTTTFNLVIGLLRPDHGQVLLDGKSVADLSMPNRVRLYLNQISMKTTHLRLNLMFLILHLLLSMCYLFPLPIHRRPLDNTNIRLPILWLQLPN